MGHISYYKAHEIRMWMKDIIIPSVTGAAVMGAYLYQHPEVVSAGRNAIKKFFKKEGKA